MICKHCGAQNADGAFFCISCGCRLDEDNAQNQSQSYNYGYSQPNGNFSQQYNQQSNAQDFDRQQNGAYSYNYNQSYNYTPINPDFVKKGSIIAALVVGIVLQNWVAVILAIIALVRCSDFENAVRMGNYPLADQKRASIAKLRKWAWVFDIIGIVFAVIGIIITIASVGLGLFSSFLPEILNEFGVEYYDEFYEFSEMMIRSISLLK